MNVLRKIEVQASKMCSTVELVIIFSKIPILQYIGRSPERGCGDTLPCTMITSIQIKSKELINVITLCVCKIIPKQMEETLVKGLYLVNVKDIGSQSKI